MRHRKGSVGLATLVTLVMPIVSGCAEKTPPPRRAEPARRVEARKPPPPPPPTRRDAYTGPTVMVTPEGKIQLPGELHYQVGTSNFTADGHNEPLLKALLHYLETHPKVTRIRVEGHTDSRGSAGFNQRISGQRALQVKTWLTSHAVAAKRVVAVGCGEIKPLATNRTPQGRAQNRRTTIWITEMDDKPHRGRDANGGCAPF